jgi:hypothetical protein
VLPCGSLAQEDNVKFVAISTNIGDPSPHIAAEGARIDELVNEGVIERVLLKADWSGAVLILDAPDEHLARSAVDSLPIAAHGLTQFILTPVLDPADAASAT